MTLGSIQGDSKLMVQTLTVVTGHSNNDLLNRNVLVLIMLVGVNTPNKK